MVPTLREIIIEAALMLLQRDGLRLSPEDLTYANVFRYLDDRYGVTVTRGSVHERIWPNQRAFRFDVLKSLVGHNYRNYAITVDALDKALLTVPAGLDARERADELFRVAGNEHFKRRIQADGTIRFPEPHAITINARPDERDELTEIHRRESDRELERWAALVAGVTRRLGLVPKAELGLDHDQASRILAQLGATSLHGFCLDYNTGQTFIGEPFLLQRPGSERALPWNCFAIALMAYQRLLFEPGDSDRLDRSSIRSEERRSPGEGPAPVAELLAREQRDGSNGRRKRSDLRDLVIAAAVEKVTEEGLVLRPGEISYKPVFEMVEEVNGFTVNRSSVHRRYWADQEAFQYDVLTQVAERIPRMGNEFLYEVHARLPVALNADGTVNRRQTMLDTIRMSTALHDEHYVDDPDQLLRFRLKCSLLEMPRNERTDELKRVLTESHLKLNRAVMQTYSEPMRRLGLQVNPELGLDWDQAMFLHSMMLTSIALALDFESLAGVSAVTEEYKIPRADGAGTDRWSIKGLSQWAITDYLFQFPSGSEVNR